MDQSEFTPSANVQAIFFLLSWVIKILKEQKKH